VELFSTADLAAALDCVGAMAEAGAELDTWARAGVDSLPRVVASEMTTLSVCDLASGRREVTGGASSALGAADRAAFDRYFLVHPLVRYHGLERHTGVHRISDSVPFVRFRETELYAEYYRRIGIDHAVAIPLAVGGGRLVSFVLNRRRLDFSDREVALLDVVGARLSQGYRRLVAARSRSAAHTVRVAGDGQLVARAPAGGNGGAEHGLTPREREVLRWLAAGKTDRDIAAILAVSPRTVQKHLERSYQKLGVETRTAAVMRAFGIRLPAEP
jgi:DNA-binding CsgD family transcriptional regulator